jgi:hypothetical protein
MESDAANAAGMEPFQIGVRRLVIDESNRSEIRSPSEIVEQYIEVRLNESILNEYCSLDPKRTMHSFDGRPRRA